MLSQVVLLMGFQLVGEAIVTALGIPFPGPLCGMALLLGYLHVNSGAGERLRAVGDTLLEHLGLLFVPAGTAVVTYTTLLASEGIPIFAALLLSTVAAVLAGGVLAGRTTRADAGPGG